MYLVDCHFELVPSDSGSPKGNIEGKQNCALPWSLKVCVSQLGFLFLFVLVESLKNLVVLCGKIGNSFKKVLLVANG